MYLIYQSYYSRHLTIFLRYIVLIMRKCKPIELENYSNIPPLSLFVGTCLWYTDHSSTPKVAPRPCFLYKRKKLQTGLAYPILVFSCSLVNARLMSLLERNGNDSCFLTTSWTPSRRRYVSWRPKCCTCPWTACVQWKWHPCNCASGKTSCRADHKPASKSICEWSMTGVSGRISISLQRTYEQNNVM